MEQNDDAILELIEQYLRDELSLEEKNKFEQRLNTDIEFALVFKVE